MQIAEIEPEVKTSEWARNRYTGIGGSEAGAAMGVSKWTSPFTLYCRKKGLVEDSVDNQFTYWGKVLEAPIVEWFATTTDALVVTNQELARFLYHSVPNSSDIHDINLADAMKELVDELEKKCDLTESMSSRFRST